MDELEAETTDAETESEEEEDIVLVEKRRVKSAFLDDEAEVSDDGETSDGEDEAVEDMSHGKTQAAGATVKSTFEEDEVDVPADDSEASMMSRASMRGIPHSSTVQKIDETLASTQQLSGNYFIVCH
jgi:hypothetical protein